VLLTDEGINGVFAHVVNESPQARSFELELSAWRNGDVKVAGGKRSIALAAHAACSVAGVELLDHFMDLSYAYRFGPPPCDAVVATLRSHAGEQLAQAFHFPAGMPSLPEPDVGLSATVRVLDEATAELTVRTRRMALAVHFELDGARAQHEYFHLEPDGEASVILQLEEGKPPAGSVHAINSMRSARWEPAAARSCHVEQTR
jgi:beta-mannosidase